MESGVDMVQPKVGEIETLSNPKWPWRVEFIRRMELVSRLAR